MLHSCIIEDDARAKQGAPNLKPNRVLVVVGENREEPTLP